MTDFEIVHEILLDIKYNGDHIRDVIGEDMVFVVSSNVNWIRVIIGKENFNPLDLTPFREDLQEMIEFIHNE